jgi:hypothetical protein
MKGKIYPFSKAVSFIGLGSVYGIIVPFISSAVTFRQKGADDDKEKNP